MRLVPATPVFASRLKLSVPASPFAKYVTPLQHRNNRQSSSVIIRAMTQTKSPISIRSKGWFCRLNSSFPKRKGTSLDHRPVYTSADSRDNGSKMGKSNKFDYTNRPNSGAKLGQIIGSALQKEAEKVKKDAERLLQKGRKQSADSSHGNLESGLTTHVIDLKAPNKDLSDEGVCALLDGLEIGLKNGTPQAPLALEDLNLSGNSISTVSLARLGPVIRLARYDLKTLNLADNKIRVETTEQAAQWESFLLAFRDCMKLRRLDLSGNSDLGSRAMEVLARAHITEPPINPISHGGESETLSLISEHRLSEEKLSPHGKGEVASLTHDFNRNIMDPQIIKRRCGLRSIPYITLHNIGLDDIGALWLSYVLEDHFYPNQLIDELNATTPDSPVKTYQQDANFYGLDWIENKTLGKEGRALLEKVETLRRQAMFDDRGISKGSVTNDADSAFGDGMTEEKLSLERGHSKVIEGGRRVSVRSIRTADGGEHEVTELESARKKLKRYVIAHDGASSIELWHSALRFFRTSRLLLYITPVQRKCYAGPPLFELLNKQSVALGDLPLFGSNAKLHNSTDTASNYDPSRQASYASKLAAASNGATVPELAITDVTNTPATPMILQRPTHRKGAFSEGTDLSTLTEKLNIAMERDSSPLRFVTYQQCRVAKASAEGRGFRDKSTPCHLPRDVMQHIVSFTMSRREMDVMSEEQKKAALGRGQLRETLTTEREWLKKDESAQVLMLLDSIGCLAYQQ